MSASHAAQVRQQLQAFTLGGITALYFGYVRVSHDVWSAAEAVDSRLDTLGKETVGGQASLQKRVGSLEGEIAKLKGELAEIKEKARG